MKTSSNWLKVIRRKFAKNSASRDIIIVHSNPTSKSQAEAEEEEDTATLLIDLARASTVSLPAKPPTKEDVAATTIQAYFRSHLARRAFRALRGIVKLQAMVRGARVRKQARIAMHCMHAMVRLQVSVRTRQLLGATPPRVS